MKGDTFQTKAWRVMLGNSLEFRRLRHAVEKAAGDQDRAIRNVCRLYGVKLALGGRFHFRRRVVAGQ
jgi:hypothetical protein